MGPQALERWRLCSGLSGTDVSKTSGNLHRRPRHFQRHLTVTMLPFECFWKVIRRRRGPRRLWIMDRLDSVCSAYRRLPVDRERRWTLLSPLVQSPRSKSSRENPVDLRAARSAARHRTLSYPHKKARQIVRTDIFELDVDPNAGQGWLLPVRAREATRCAGRGSSYASRPVRRGDRAAPSAPTRLMKKLVKCRYAGAIPLPAWCAA